MKTKLPLVVLVNEVQPQLQKLYGGSLQDQKRAIIIGEKLLEKVQFKPLLIENDKKRT